MPATFTIYDENIEQQRQQQQEQQALPGTTNVQQHKSQQQQPHGLADKVNVLSAQTHNPTAKSPPRYIPEISKDGRFFFEDWGLYPIGGGEYSFEEIRFRHWNRQNLLKIEKKRVAEYKQENENLIEQLGNLRLQLENLSQQNANIVQQNNSLLQQLEQTQLQLKTIQQNQLQNNSQPNLQQTQQMNTMTQASNPPSAEQTGMPESVQIDQTMAMDVDFTSAHRLSVVPQSLQNATCLEYTADMSCYGMVNDAPTAVQNLWQATFNQSTGDRYTIMNKANNSFTVPIDQSEYIKNNIPTSTPAAKRPGPTQQIDNNTDNNPRRSSLNVRRLSRPSITGSPTLKLSPIEETSRELNSKSSSSSSGMSNTPGTIKKPLAPVPEPIAVPVDDRPLDPNDPSTYNQLLRMLPEPVNRRAGYVYINTDLPNLFPGETLISAQRDDYLVDKLLSEEDGIYTANLISDDSNESTYDVPLKMFCFKVDKPANEWLFYICNELNRRLVKQKMIPDIELSVTNLNPALIYNNGSIMVDEFMRYIPIDRSFKACLAAGKPFPKSVAAYLILELIQIVRQMHKCDIVHLNIKSKNLLFTSCLARDDIASVGERTSIIKLIGFDRALDTRLLPPGTKFTTPLNDITCCEMMDNKPWNYEVDWFCVLNCIHNMFFLKDMLVSKNEISGKWKVDQTFHGFPTDCWATLFDTLLNIEDYDAAMNLVDQVIEELNAWIKANTSFVVKESANLEMILDKFK